MNHGYYDEKIRYMMYRIFSFNFYINMGVMIIS